MRVLIGKTFGIGNAVLAIPMIKAISTIAEVDVLVGTTSDDFGATEVIAHLVGKSVKNIWLDHVPTRCDGYDVAVMAIPFDGRWVNGVHFNAEAVIDCRKRPNNIDRLGFDMWEKHEAEYQMENARALGYSGPTPGCNFLSEQTDISEDLVYIGIGYKRDHGGFGLSKHFGNERYAELIKEIRRIRPKTHFCSTGGPSDMIHVGYQIIKNLQDDSTISSETYRFRALGMQESFRCMMECKAYIGNDTGMMHVAAAIGMPTLGLFAYPDLITKNPPLCDRSRSIVFGNDFPPMQYIAEQFVDFVWGDR